MASLAQVYSVSDVTDQVVAAATETVVATLPSIITDTVGRSVRLSAVVIGTGVAGTTGATIQIRRTSLTGTLIGEAYVDTRIFVGAVTGVAAYAALDAPGEVAGLPYVLTLTPAGGQITKLQAQLFAFLDRG